MNSIIYLPASATLWYLDLAFYPFDDSNHLLLYLK